MFGSVRLKSNLSKNVLSPQDVSKYVQKVESKLTGTLERKSKSFAFARMYFEAKDYELAKRYLEDYVSVQDRDYRVFNLMGEINEALEDSKEALVSYKRSLELNSTQKDILIKVLILSKKCKIDPLRAKVWADKGAKICPGNPAVFDLKWYILEQKKPNDYEEMELLLADELSRRPRDSSLHIKLVKVYKETGSYHQAAQHCQSVEKTSAFNDSIQWLDCACDVFNEYRKQKDGLETNFHFVLVLCKLMRLHLRQSPSNECLRTLQSFDHHLHEMKRTLSVDRRMSFGRELSDCLKEMTGQLYMSAATYFMKLANEGKMSWMKANQLMSIYLLTCWSIEPPSLTPKLFARHSPLKRNNPQVYDWSVLACDRLSQAGHLILLLESQFNEEWLRTQLNDYCNNKGQSVYNDHLKIAAKDQSYLAKDEKFFDTELTIPNPNELVKFDEVSVAEHAQDLHLIIWLGLHWEKLNEHMKPGVGVLVGRLFEGIGLDVKNMKNSHFSSLCLRDVEAFLYAVIRSSKSIYLEGSKDEDRLFLLPADITSSLITKAQEEWWKSAYCLYTGKMGSETIGKLKVTLQKGLETIRCLRDHGIDPRILVYMATAFWEKAAAIQSEKKTEYDYQDHWESLQQRAIYYMKEAIRILEIFKRNKTITQPENPLIPPLASPLLPDQIVGLLKTCYLKLAESSMLSGQLLDAIKYYEEVNTLQALYSQVQIYSRLASQCDVDTVEGEKDHLYYTKKAIEKIHICINNAEHSPEFKQSLLEQLKELQSGAISSSPNSRTNATAATLKGFKKSLDFQSTDETDDRELKAEDLASSITADDVVSIERSMLQDQIAAKDTELATMKQHLEIYKAQLELAKHQLILQNQIHSPVLNPVLPGSVMPPQMLQGMHTPSHNVMPMSAHPVHSNQQYPASPMQNVPSNPPAVFPAGATPLSHQNIPGPNSGSIPRAMSSIPVHMQNINATPQMATGQIPMPQPPNYQTPVIPPVMPQVNPQVQGQAVRRVNSNGSIVITPTIRNGMETPTDMWWDSFSPQPSFEKGYFAGLAEHVEQSREELGEEEAPTMRDDEEGTPQQHDNGDVNVTPSGVVNNATTPKSVSPKKISVVEYDDIYVQPIVKLESVADTKTGEEDETVKFTSRAKLYRFDKEASQWKERGVGDVKILTNENTGKSRITMRRDQIFRVCCNHFITPEIFLEQKAGAKAAWTWFTPADATDEQIRPEQFTIKFKTQDIADEFKATFESCKDSETNKTEKLPPIVAHEVNNDTKVVPVAAITPVNAPDANKSFSIITADQSFVTSSLANSTSYPNKIAFDTTLESTMTPRFQLSSESAVPTTTTSTFTFGGASKDVITKSPDGKPLFNFATVASNNAQPAKVNPFIESLQQQNTATLPPFKPGEMKQTIPEVTTPPASIPSNPFADFSFNKPTVYNQTASVIVSTSSSPFSGFSFSSQQSNTTVASPPPALQTTPSQSVGFPLMKSLLQTAAQQTTTTTTVSPIISGMSTLPVFNKGVVSASIDPTAFWTSVSPQKPFFTGNTTGLEKYGHTDPCQGASLDEEIEMTKFQGNGTLSIFVEDTNSWQKYASGEIQILLDENTFVSRITLLDETTFKICCNHYVTTDIILTHGNEATVTYSVVNDEFLMYGTRATIKIDFESKEKAEMFKEAVLSCQTFLGIEPREIDEAEFFMENMAASNVSRENMYYGEDYYYGEYDEHYGDNENGDHDDVEYDSDDEYEGDEDEQPSTGSSSRLGSTDQLKDLKDDSKQVEARFEIQRKENLPKQRDVIDDDLVITYETKPSFAEKLRASRLRLPPTFYMYQSKPPCPGCLGCTDLSTSPKKVSLTKVVDTKQPLLKTDIDKTDTVPSLPKGEHVFGSTLFTGTQTFASLASPGTDSGFRGASGAFAGSGTPLFANTSADAHNDEHDPHYDAIVQLSKVSSTKTGEEEDEVIFKHRAKLYRFEQQWKERGVGDIKLTKNKTNGYCRVIMRRDAIFKVCANHAISPEMELKPLSTSDKSWVWFTPSDYSEGLPPVPQKFCVKFKNKEVADEFKTAFEQLQVVMKDVLEKDANNDNKNTDDIEPPTTDQSRIQVSEKPSEEKPSSGGKPSVFSKFAMNKGEWECPTCMIRNDVSLRNCAACQTLNPNVKETSDPSNKSCDTQTASPFSFGLASNIKNAATPFSFGNSEAKSNLPSSTPAIASGFTFGSVQANPTTTAASGFTFGSAQANPTTTAASGFTFGSAQANTITTTASGFTFGSAQANTTTTTASGFTFGAPATTSTSYSGFSFGNPQTVTSSSSSGFSFGTTTNNKDGNTALTFGTPSNVTSSTLTAVTSSNTPANDETKSNIINNTDIPSSNNMSPFKIESTQFKNDSPFKFSVPSSADTPSASVNEDHNATVHTQYKTQVQSPVHDKNNDDDDDIHVEAIVQVSKLDKITTGEENDEILFKQRAKLFRFDSSSKQWKERGIGEIKLTRNTRDNVCRVLMRREQIHKICANHVIMPPMELKPITKSDKSWAWFTQADISEGDVRAEQFSVRFKTADIANDFKSAFDKCVKLSETNKLDEQKNISEPSHGSSEVDEVKKDISDALKKSPKEPEKKSIFSKFAPSADSWECSICMINNNKNSTNCVACANPNPNVSSAQDAQSINSQLKEAPKFSFGLQGSSQSTEQNDKKDSPFSFGSQFTGSGFSFGLPANSSAEGVSDKKQENTIESNIASWECASCLAKNKMERTECRSCNSPKIKTPNVKLDPQVFSAPISFSKTSGPVFSDVLAPKQNSASAFGFTFGSTNQEKTTPASGAGFSFGTKPTGSAANFSFGQTILSKPLTVDAEKEKVDRELMPPPQIIPPVSNKTKTSPNQGKKKESNSSIFSWMPKGLNTDNLFSLGSTPTPTLSAASSVDDITETRKPEDVAPAFSGTAFTFQFDTPTKPVENKSSVITPTGNVKSPAHIKSPDIVSSPTTLEEESNVEFTPLVSLVHVERETGEECEAEIFNERAKMFRFKGGQWKERGVGELKILQHRVKKGFRVIMRRDQTHKLCANHALLHGMTIKAMSGNNKAYIWKTLADHSGDDITEEMFAAKFKSEEIALRFVSVFEASCEEKTKDDEDIVGEMAGHDNAGGTTSNTAKKHEVIVISDDDDDDLKEKVLPEGIELTYENELSDDLLKEKARKLYLPPKFYCETSTVIGQHRPTKTEAITTAEVNDTTNEYRVASIPETVPDTSRDILFDGFGELLSNLNGEFVEVATGKIQVVYYETKDKAFIICYNGDNSFVEHDVSKVVVKSDTDSKMMAQWKFEDQSEVDHCAKFDSVLSLEKFLVAINKARDFVQVEKTKNKDAMSAVFGRSSQLTSFAALATSENENAFKSNAGKNFATTGQVLFQANSEGGDQAEEGDIHVEPIVQVTPIAVSSGEENEKPVFKQRSKMYRYDKKDRRWKERGIGEIRLLLNETTKKARLIMRRDQTRKLCANHILLAGMELAPFPSNELTVTWNAVADVSDGEPMDCIFAAKFKNAELLNSYKATFRMLCDGTYVNTAIQQDEDITSCDPKLLDQLNIS